MGQIPTIPRINRVKLVGYQPLYKRTIEFEIKNGRFLILGGNGLGKTTMLQSIVYCIAGEADLAIELDRRNRWTRNYFRSRLDNPDMASIEVEFFLGDHKITLGRGFRNKSLLNFTLDEDFMVENPRDAEWEFERFLREEAGYPSIDDFRYMVHKLCYLPENRVNLVWNSEAQIRLIMLMFNDIIDESEFRAQRGLMKQFDSARRHIQVRLNDAREVRDQSKQLTDVDKIQPEKPQPQLVLTVQPTPPADPQERDYSQIVERLTALAQQRIDIQKKLQDIKKSLSDLTIDIEALQEQLAREEEGFILSQLNKLESEEAKLAIHKLLHRKQCPACGTVSEELSAKAQEYTREGRCPLCGTEHTIRDAQQLPLLDAELSERLRGRVNIEEELVRLERELEVIQIEEEGLQLQYDERLIERMDETLKAAALEEEISADEVKQLVNAVDASANETPQEKVDRLQREYESANMRFIELQGQLEEKYSAFNQASHDRIDLLAQLYRDYATAFLGIDCELERHKSEIKFIDVQLFVPKFDDKIRPNPESCSEAQRFFLDIAFRMAMIDLCYKLVESHGSFICETPENALDITYVDNVAEMFKSFSRRGHIFIATSNLQPGALAGPILSDYTLEQKRESILNLLDYGVLSKVQTDHLPALEKQLAEIMKE